MTTRRTTEVVSVCTDCLMLAANGEMPHSETGNGTGWAPLDRLDDGLILAPGDGEGHFSHRGCDTCTTHLGGDRHDAYLITITEGN